MDIANFITTLFSNGFFITASSGVGSMVVLGYLVGLIQSMIPNKQAWWKNFFSKFATKDDVNSLRDYIKEVKDDGNKDHQEIKSEMTKVWDKLDNLAEDFREVKGYLQARKEARFKDGS